MLQDAFQSIRRENSILWAGAGLSMYAGFPNGKQLRDYFCKFLTKEQSKQYKHFDLDRFCEAYIKINGRESLNDLIVKKFSMKPKSLREHSLLSKIPHFNSIITTNYDEMFEKACNNIQVVVREEEIPHINKSQPHLIKIHGDIHNLDRIIISTSDYARFYNKELNSPFWTVVKERLICNDVVFLGYNLGDINIMTILEDLSEKLSSSKRKIFFVAPNWLDEDIKSLREKGIIYLDYTAEEFLNMLMADLKKNIIEDYKNGDVSFETYNRFLSCHDLTGDFLANGNSHIHSNIRPVEGKVLDGNITLSLSNSEITSQLNQYLRGDIVREIKLPSDTLKKLTYTLNGINITDADVIKDFTMTRNPWKEMCFDIIFKNGFELIDVPVKVYVTQLKFLFYITLGKKNIEIEMSRTDITKVSFLFSNNDDNYADTQSEIELFSLLKYLCDNIPFHIFVNGVKHQPVQSVKLNNEFKKWIESILDYLLVLKKIEKQLDFRLKEVGQITNRSFQMLQEVEEIIEGKEIFYTQTAPFSITLAKIGPKTKSDLIKINSSGTENITFKISNSKIELLGHEIDIPFKVIKLYKPFVSNLEAVLNGETNKVEFTSQSNSFSEKYFLSIPPAA